MTRIDWGSIIDMRLAMDSLPYILGGLGHTLWISLVSMGMGLLIGLPLAIGRRSRFIMPRLVSRMYISFMRGVPILVLLFMLYYGFPIIGIEFDALTAAILGFGLSSAAFIAEIIRAAIGSIDRGQNEAALSLGLSRSRILFGIIVPQASRVAIPPLSNVLLDLVKASSLAAMITVPEIFQRAKIIGGREFDYMTVYIVVAFVYWGICVFISALQDFLEGRFSRYL